MASSIFLWPGFFSSNGSGIVFAQSGLFPDGTTALPGIAFALEPSSGLQRSGAGDISLQVLGVSRLEASGTNTAVKAPDGGAYFQVSTGAVQVNSASLSLANAGTPKFIFSAATANDAQAVVTNGAGAVGVGLDVSSDAVLKIRTRAQSAYASLDALALRIGGVLAISGTAPTITSAGTSPSIASSNGSFTFQVNVGTGGTATTIVLAMPTAPNGWNAYAENITATAANRAAGDMVMQSSTPNSLTLQYQTVATGGALAFTASDIVAVIAVPF